MSFTSFFVFVIEMSDFCISCKYLENIRSTVNEFPEYRDRMFTIIINETFYIELPLIIASSFSSSITKIIKNDPTTNELHISLKTRKTNSLESLNKIKSVLCKNSKISFKEEYEEDIYTFASFGIAIGNEDFVKPLRTRLSSLSSDINENNVVELLRSKQTFEFGIDEMNPEISFISTNFENISTREDFINFSKEPSNTEIVESIISSEELQMNNEDTLLTFLMEINKQRTLNDISTELFKHVFFEYCSPDKCEEFISFICSNLEEGNTKTLIACLGRRFTQPNMPMNTSFIEGRHQIKVTKVTKPRELKGTLIDNKDPLNGILRREHEKGNVLLEPSSKGNGSDDVYSLLKADDNSYFYTNNSPNQFIKASLKDGKTFILKSYMIRGNLEYSDCHQLQNWKLEGERASDREWILLDSHNEDPTKQLQIRTFNVSCEEPLKSVKLTQTGRNSCPYIYYYFEINAFDIFGFLVDK